jgi:hypothetical protein
LYRRYGSRGNIEHRSGVESECLVSRGSTAKPEVGLKNAPAAAGSPRPAADLNALIAEAADYQHLRAEGKLGEAGQKLEELKRVLDKLNIRQR